MLNPKVHKKFMNEFVFINHFESSQIYEHFSQHGNTGLNCLGACRSKEISLQWLLRTKTVAYCAIRCRMLLKPSEGSWLKDKKVD